MICAYEWLDHTSYLISRVSFPNGNWVKINSISPCLSHLLNEPESFHPLQSGSSRRCKQDTNQDDVEILKGYKTEMVHQLKVINEENTQRKGTKIINRLSLNDPRLIDLSTQETWKTKFNDSYPDLLSHPGPNPEPPNTIDGDPKDSRHL